MRLATPPVGLGAKAEGGTFTGVLVASVADHLAISALTLLLCRSQPPTRRHNHDLHEKGPAVKCFPRMVIASQVPTKVTLHLLWTP